MHGAAQMNGVSSDCNDNAIFSLRGESMCVAEFNETEHKKLSVSMFMVLLAGR